MNNKRIILILALLLIFSLPLQAAQLNVTLIKELIEQGDNYKALEMLKENDISDNPDLRFYKALLYSWNSEYDLSIEILKNLIEEYPERIDFYTHLGRVYGWKGEYKKAETIIKRAQVKDKTPQRTALLAQLAEWQHHWYKAYSLRQEAYNLAKGTELEAEYEKFLKRAESKLKPTNFIETELRYDDQLNTNLLAGQNRFIRNGIKIEGSAGLNLYDDELNYLLRAKLNKPMYRNMKWSGGIEYLSGGKNKNINYNASFNYKIDQKNTLGFYLNAYDYEQKTDYQTIELEEQYRFNGDNVIVFKNTSRHDSTGWTLDFSQHLDYYYPRDNYVMHFTASRYKGGEYLFRFGIEISNKILNKNLELESFNSWINSKRAANLDMRFNLRK